MLLITLLPLLPAKATATKYVSPFVIALQKALAAGVRLVHVMHWACRIDGVTLWWKGVSRHCFTFHNFAFVVCACMMPIIHTLTGACVGERVGDMVGGGHRGSLGSAGVAGASTLRAAGLARAKHSTPPVLLVRYALALNSTSWLGVWQPGMRAEIRNLCARVYVFGVWGTTHAD